MGEEIELARAPYDRFADNCRVDVVRHDDHDAEFAVRRAEWLLSFPARPDAATTGSGSTALTPPDGARPDGKPESLQIRHRIFGGKAAFVGLPLTFWLAWVQRTNRRLPRWAWLVAGADLATTAVTQHLYHNGIRHFNKHLRENCPPELRGPASVTGGAE